MYLAQSNVLRLDGKFSYILRYHQVIDTRVGGLLPWFLLYALLPLRWPHAIWLSMPRAFHCLKCTSFRFDDDCLVEPFFCQKDHRVARVEIEYIEATGEVTCGAHITLMSDWCTGSNHHAGGGMGFLSNGDMVFAVGDMSTVSTIFNISLNIHHNEQQYYPARYVPIMCMNKNPFFPTPRSTIIVHAIVCIRAEIRSKLMRIWWHSSSRGGRYKTSRV